MLARKKRTHISAMMLVGILILLTGGRLKSDNAKAAVTLLFFQGEQNGESILLQWATATEFDTAYFYLERADTEAGPYVTLDQIGLVQSDAPPDGLSGAQYERLDNDGLIVGNTYWYVLVEVERSQGAENRTDPVGVTLDDTLAQQTATPTATPSATPGPTGQATATGSAPSPTPSLMATSATGAATLTPSIARTPVSGNDVQDQVVTDPDTAEASSQESDSNQIQDPVAPGQATPGTEGYPPPATFDSAGSGQEGIDGYPAQPPSVIFATASYPDKTLPTDPTNGTPVPNIGSRAEALVDGGSEESTTAETPVLLGTLFLWLGFVAAFVIFISAVSGAIYYFSRQRTGGN